MEPPRALPACLWTWWSARTAGSARSATEIVAEAAADGQTEVTVLLPRQVLRRVLGLRPARPDRPPDRERRRPGAERHRDHRPVPGGQAAAPDGARQARISSGLATAGGHRRPVSAPTGIDVPAWRPGSRPRRSEPRGSRRCSPASNRRARSRWQASAPASAPVSPGGSAPSGSSHEPGVPSLECTLADSSAQLTLVFQGRRRVPGIEPGALARRRGHGRSTRPRGGRW